MKAQDISHLCSPSLIILALVVVTGACPLPSEAAADPPGVRFRHRAETKTIFVDWELSKEQVIALTGEKRVTGLKPIIADLYCSVENKYTKVTRCPVPDSAWHGVARFIPDFGPEMYYYAPTSGASANTTLLFFEDRFFSVVFDFDIEEVGAGAMFLELVEALEERLGPPAVDDSSTIQNRMGAEFDQRTVSWKTESVLVTMTFRGRTLEKSRLTITYLPVAAEVPERPRLTAPF